MIYYNSNVNYNKRLYKAPNYLQQNIYQNNINSNNQLNFNNNNPNNNQNIYNTDPNIINELVNIKYQQLNTPDYFANNITDYNYLNPNINTNFQKNNYNNNFGNNLAILSNKNQGQLYLQNHYNNNDIMNLLNSIDKINNQQQIQQYQNQYLNKKSQPQFQQNQNQYLNTNNQQQMIKNNYFGQLTNNILNYQNVLQNPSLNYNQQQINNNWLQTSINNNSTNQQFYNNNYQINNNYSPINKNPTDNTKIKVVLDELIRPRGLENVGATCYMNATLQCFYHVKELSETLINDYSINRQLEMTYCYKNLIEELSGCKDRKKYWINRQNQNQYDNSKDYVKPEEFKELIGRKNPLFKGINANDSKDLVIFMLENMDAELTKKNKKTTKMEIFQGDDVRQTETQNFKKVHDSIVADLFYGFQRTTMICKSCNNVNTSYSVFNFLLFPLEKIYNSLNQKNKKNIMRNNNNMNMMNMFNNNRNMYNMNNINFNNYNMNLNNYNMNMNNYKMNIMNNFNNMNMNNFNNIYNNMNNMRNFNNMNMYNMNNMNFRNNMNIYNMNNMNNFNNIYNNNMNNMNNFNNMFKNMFNPNSYRPNISNNQLQQYFNLNNRNGINNIFNSPTTTDPLKNISDLPRNLELEKCFEEFEVAEILSGENQIYCNNCHKSSDASTKTEIYKSPKVLIIILNRGRGNIFQCDVKFPSFLNISKFTKKDDSPKFYDLIGVISHLGESSMEGHFIAFCKHFDGNWFLFNDSIVKNVSEQDIFRGTPYILFYQNRI